VGEAVYEIDNFPDDDLRWCIEWIGGVKHRLRGGSGFFTETATKVDGILRKYHRSPTGLGFGNVGVVLGPSQANWDMRVTKLFTLKEEQTVQFRSAFFNTFNHPQFANPGLKAAVATFGQITLTSVSSRVIQLVLKCSF
jgi:hypothetical protein